MHKAVAKVFVMTKTLLGVTTLRCRHRFLSGPLSIGKKMDLPLAQLRSLLASKICLLGGHWLTRTHCLHHVLKSWTVPICWKSSGQKETTHIKQASSPVFPQKMGNVQRWCVKKSSIDIGAPPWALAFLVVSAHVSFESTKSAS